jgi:hypothetical protein
MFIVIIETVREYVMGSGEQRGTKGGECSSLTPQYLPLNFYRVLLPNAKPEHLE